MHRPGDDLLRIRSAANADRPRSGYELSLTRPATGRQGVSRKIENMQYTRSPSRWNSTPTRTSRA